MSRSGLKAVAFLAAACVGSTARAAPARAGTATAPAPDIRLFTTRDGLACDQLSGVVQDARGFLWISTADGLSRYDGTEFVSYYHQVGDSSILPSNHINCMKSLGGNRIALATYNGLCILNTRSMRYRTFQERSHPAYETYNNDFVDVRMDAFHHLWAFSVTTLYLNKA